ncbi:hypothetical protein GQR58_030051 [Nymphon striatum]|nr:hypothetical protein GQR58_030051 [Nymphon striatum]
MLIQRQRVYNLSGYCSTSSTKPPLPCTLQRHLSNHAQSRDWRSVHAHKRRCIGTGDKVKTLASDQRAAIINATQKALHSTRNYTTSDTPAGRATQAEINYRFAGLIQEQLLRIKNGAYKNEKEWRIVVDKKIGQGKVAITPYIKSNPNFRSSTFGLTPYLELKMPQASKIVVGPSPNQNGNLNAMNLVLKERTDNKRTSATVIPATRLNPISAAGGRANDFCTEKVMLFCGECQVRPRRPTPAVWRFVTHTIVSLCGFVVSSIRDLIAD